MISTHVLDTSHGCPAEGISVLLKKCKDGNWLEVSKGVTNSDGRFAFQCESSPGIYKIVFQVENYFISRGGEFFFEKIPVIFKIENTQRKYHVPLLLNPFGYSTYRGS